MEGLEKKVQDLRRQFPSWEEEAIRDVLMDCGGDVDLSASTIQEWTRTDKLDKREDTAATIKTVFEEDVEVEGGCCSCFGGKPKPKKPAAASTADTASTAAAAPAKNSSSAADTTPPGPKNAADSEDSQQPAIVERQLLDDILAKRMNWEVSGESAIMTIRAVGKIKIMAKRAKDRVRHRHEAGESSPMAIDHGDIHLQQVNSIGSTASERDRSERIQEGMKLLDQRLALLKLRQIQMEDDGNCQFRSFSSELFGTQKYHKTVRHVAVKWLKENEETCSVFATEDMPWDKYLEAMSKPRYWGDELTLFAVCEVYGVVIHLITTEKENWHTVYNPSKVKSPRHLFLAYISPIHYNTVQPMQ